MSQENVEIARSAIVAFNVDAALGMVFGFRGCELMRIHGYLDDREAVEAAELAQ